MAEVLCVYREVALLREAGGEDQIADGAYAGPKLEGALKRIGRWSLEIVNRPAGVKGFQLLPRRWVVERTLAWLNRNRRLAKDFETAIETAEARIFLASIQLLTRRLARA